MSYIRLDRAGKVYHSSGAEIIALRDISFALEPATFTALVGRSGCGKSTLLNLCGAMDFPSEGKVYLGGVSTSDLSDAALTQLRRTEIGFVFQFFQLLHTLSAIENVGLPLLLAGHGDARARARDILQWMEISELADRMPHQLSGGQMQRVAIARALVHSPKLLLADEPIGNLDSKMGAVVLQLLKRAAVERGAIVLMATHSNESLTYCDRLIRLKDGRVESDDML
jgi:ABC-type lipoprotein export system ATPase subunit